MEDRNAGEIHTIENPKRKRARKGSGCVYRPKFKTKNGKDQLGNWRIKFTWRDKAGRIHVRNEAVPPIERDGRVVPCNSEAAQEWLKKRFAEVVDGTFSPDPQPAPEDLLTYEDLRAILIMHYEVGGKRALLTRKCGEKQGQKYICSLNHVDSHFAGKLVREIDEDEIDRFVAQRRQAGASIFSINRSLGLLRQAFRLAVEKKKLSAEAVPKIRIDAKSEKQKRRKGFLEYDDFVRLRDALPERLKVVLTLGFYTGMRLGEIKNLKWSGVNLNREEIRLEADETKNGEPRTIPLLKELPTMLKMLCNEGPKPKYVFGGDRPLGNFRKTWNGTCVKVGLGEFVELPNGRKKYKGLIFHDLRRSAVRFLIDSDIPEGQIMEIVGHQTRSMFDRYAIKSAKTLREAKRKAESHLDELISQRPVKETQAESTGTEMPTQLIQ